MKGSTMINYTRKLLANIISDERGLTAVEYAVLGAIIVAGLAAVSDTFIPLLEGAFAGLLPAADPA